MELILDKNKKKEHLYLEVFHYYRELIMEKKLPPGSRMPSLRKCSQELRHVSYTHLGSGLKRILKASSNSHKTDIVVSNSKGL